MSKGFVKKGIAAGVGVMLLAAVGCTVDVYSPPPRGEVVVEGPPPPPPGEVVVTEEPPPPVVYEAPPPPPEPGVVWIEGDVVFEGGHWVRHGGHYDRPPAGRRRWVAGGWRHSDRGYVRIQGHWE